MGLVPADVEFLKELRKLCDKNGALLIFDEVMSGFRASLRGASGIVGVEADILTFGKVIGGGMPVGAFGAKAEIMDRLSPDGDIYQAGTLSGNPVAMSAGLKSLKMIKKDEELYIRLEALANMLMDGFKEGAKEAGLDIQTEVRGSMFGFFFNQNPVKNFEDAQRSDAKLFAKFHQEMLKEGVYLACSQYETGFICEPMEEKLIKKVIKKAKKVMKKIS
jgi:glutamate-1-semialdehyde 2,1-aminomutase